MSLSEWKEDLEAAAAGTASTVDDLRVRQHLRTCAECRAHYDRLVLAARALSGGSEASRSEHDALFARLNATLDQRSPAPAASRPRWWWVGALIAVAATALVVVVIRPPDEREVTLRGGGDAVETTLSFSVYAKAKTGDGPVRLLAQFPQSGEARATEGDWLQVKAPDGAAVVAVEAGGAVVVFEPVGSQELSAGRWRIFAAMASIEEARRAAAQPFENGKLKLGGAQASGVLVVAP